MRPLHTTADLLDLQELDLRIDELLERRASLPELERYRATHESLTRLGAEHTDLAGRLRSASRELDRIDGEVDLARRKLEQVQVQMYSGGSNAKEVQHLGMEVEQLQRQISDMEDTELELMEMVEELEPQVAEGAGAIERLEAEKAQLETTIKEAWAGIDAEIGRKEARKAEEVAGIDPDLVAVYERLRESRGGRVVAPLEEGRTCGSCHVALSVAEVHALRSEELPRCVHCGRLLAL